MKILRPKPVISLTSNSSSDPNCAQLCKDDTKVIELSPNPAQAYYNRGLVYKMMNKPELAEADYKKAVELNPAYANAPYK